MDEWDDSEYQLQRVCSLWSLLQRTHSWRSRCSGVFLDPSRVHALLIWFGRGHVEYKFPNNAEVLNASIDELGFSMELSSEVPGTNAGWPSDISPWVNDKKLGTWRCRRDYGDRGGKYTPLWWKLAGSPYGILTTWRIRPRGKFLGAEKLSGVNIRDLSLARHHSIRLKIGIDERGSPPGGVNIFGRGFGNHTPRRAHAIARYLRPRQVVTERFG
jgi:predicted transcriptional regulator